MPPVALDVRSGTPEWLTCNIYQVSQCPFISRYVWLDVIFNWDERTIKKIPCNSIAIMNLEGKPEIHLYNCRATKTYWPWFLMGRALSRKCVLSVSAQANFLDRNAFSLDAFLHTFSPGHHWFSTSFFTLFISFDFLVLGHLDNINSQGSVDWDSWLRFQSGLREHLPWICA